MCGLAGTFGALDGTVPARLAAIAHRGPDGSGVAAAGPAVHGHVRLSVIDLTDASAQPFRRGDGLLSYNGELWNHPEVRAALEAEGETFATTGDTEVLAAALDRWGVGGALPRLEGMWAFAWSKGDTHVLCRDRFGEIPLYVHRRGRRFAWASERKGFSPGEPATPLPPGSVLDLTSGSLRRWYALPASGEPVAALPGLLRDGVRTRLVADAPLCCLISGGLDSSLVLALARRERPGLVAYTAVLDPASPDLAAARRLCAAWEVPLAEVPVPPPSPSALAAAARAIETPMKAQVEIAALCLPLAAAIRSDGFKVCLSGEAADELFGGYGGMCIRGARADDAAWRAERVAQLAKMGRGNFVRCNKAFMAHGVECRLPFVHRPLAEAVLGWGKRDCPPGKGALKAAAAGVVPAWVVRRPKESFQGGAGMRELAAAAVADPRRFYRAEVSRAYGPAALADAA